MIFESMVGIFIFKAFLMVLLALSFLGFGLFYYQKKFDKNLVPGMVVSTVILVLFICGILNALKVSAFLLFFLGLALLVYETITTNGKLLVNYFSNNWSALFVVIASLYAMIMFKTSMLTGYDDFSHWGTVAKVMLQENRFPTSLDTVITFQSYPLGTATFIYYFETIVGIGEHGYLLAQFLLKICFVSCLFGLRNEQHDSWKGKSVVFLFSAVLLIYNTPSFSLSVDNVLSCCGIFCVIATYLSIRDSYKHAAFAFMISAGCCIVVKNSGIFFWLAGAIVYVLASHRLRQRKEFIKYDLIFLVIPLIVLFLWQRHVDYVFIDGLASKHSMTLSHGMGVFRTKTIEEIQDEILFISSIIINPLKDRAIIILIGIMIHFLLSRTEDSRKQLYYYTPLYLVCLFIIYQCGMMIMYLFSMPHSEIVYQNGIDYARYNGTFVAFSAALYLGYIYESYHGSRREKALVLLAVVLIGAALGNRIHIQDINPNTVTSVYYKDKCEIKSEIENQLESIDLQDGQRVLIRVREEDNEANYIYYMMRYLLLNDQFGITTCADETEFMQSWEQSDCGYCIDTITHTVLKRD